MEATRAHAIELLNEAKLCADPVEKVGSAEKHHSNSLCPAADHGIALLWAMPGI